MSTSAIDSSVDGSCAVPVTLSTRSGHVRFVDGEHIVGDSGVSTVKITAEHTTVPCVEIYDDQGGTARFIDAATILGPAFDGVPSRDGDSSSSEEGGGVGWPRAGKGRRKGSGLDLRGMLCTVLVVKLAAAAYINLRDLFMSEDMDSVDIASLKQLRYQYQELTDAALQTRAWWLGPSGTVGVLIKFGAGGSRDNNGRHLCVGVQAELTDKGVVCTCSESESCLARGCSIQPAMEQALEAVRQALGVTMRDLFTVLSAACNPRSRAVGRARLYGKGVCVVRMGGGSWPFAVVRKTRAHNWVCILCRTNDTGCGHVKAASAAARRAAEGEPATDSDREECSSDDHTGADDAVVSGPDENGVVAIDEAVVAAEATNTAEACKAPADTPAAPKAVDNSRLAPHSQLPRHLVPPAAAQRELAAMMAALRDPSIVITYPAAQNCQHCGSSRLPGTRKFRRAARVECGAGAARASVTFWRCWQCHARVIPDGRDRGVVFQSTTTVFSEVFLFETAVSLSRNGCSLRSSAYLREAFHELSAPHLYWYAAERLTSVSTLRKAVVLYLSLVIKGVPAAVSQCATCRRADGSYAIVCFDGLQLGYRVKYKLPFKHISVKLRAS
ncbi:hypothetical protein MMPV_004419 [Pyropia vietnamensis]